MKRFLNPLILAGLFLAVVGLWPYAAGAQNFPKQDPPGLPTDLPQEIGPKLTDRIPEKPTLPVSLSIPLRPLGYSVPGVFYLGRHNRLASLDFIGENRLLFTFQVAGLMHRRDEESGPESEERQIHAVVVTLPDGKTEAEAQWTLHDRVRYLWMLKDGHFLLRDGDGVQEGDATLALKPLLHFPGRLLWLELNPAQQLMSVSFLMPPAKPKGMQPGAPATAPASLIAGEEKPRLKLDPPELKPDLVVRTLNRETGKVLSESRVGLAVPRAASSDGYTSVEEGMLSGLLDNAQLPINSEGSIATPGEDYNRWHLDFRPFDGKAKFLSRVSSACRPFSEFISEGEFLMTACDVFDGWDVVALSSSGNRLWGVRISNHEVWPQVVSSLDGSRLARETVVLDHAVPVGRPRPVDPKNLKGQIVRVFDAANGKVVFETTASPILDGGGNIAISPSGRRLAVLNDGAIQVFDLPPADTPRVRAP